MFQDICLPPPQENPLTDPVDLLSVTTTMEAGVDIGTLRCRDDGEHAADAIQLSATCRPRRPPRSPGCPWRSRSAGAAVTTTTTSSGRNGSPPTRHRSPMSTCAGRASSGVCWPRRFFGKRFRRSILFAGGGGDSVHGEFGRAQDWNQPPPSHRRGPARRNDCAARFSWIQQNANEVARVTRRTSRVQRSHAAGAAASPNRLLRPATCPSV